MGYRAVSPFHSIRKTPYCFVITLCDYLVVLHQRYEFISAEQLGCYVFLWVKTFSKGTPQKACGFCLKVRLSVCSSV